MGDIGRHRTGEDGNPPKYHKDGKAHNQRAWVGRAAYVYLRELGHVVEKWMKSSIEDRCGPLMLIDRNIPEYPIRLAIVIPNYPRFGPKASTNRYQFTLNFDVATDYTDNFNMTDLKTDVLPALGRAKATVVKSRQGDTFKKIAERVWGVRGHYLVNLIRSSNPGIEHNGKIRPGSTVVVPYAPLPTDYVNFTSAVAAIGTSAGRHHHRPKSSNVDPPVPLSANNLHDGYTFGSSE